MFSKKNKLTSVSSPLDQYVDTCQEAVNKACGSLKRPFKKLLSEILLLMILVPNRVNFTQLAKYGKKSEKCYRQNFEHPVDWLGINNVLAEVRFRGYAGRRAIVIDPSYIDKNGKHTPGLGRFWSGCAGAAKHGLEIMGIGVVDIDAHDCMMLRAAQTPSPKTLKEAGLTLVDWYGESVVGYKDELLKISPCVIGDPYFSVKPFVDKVESEGFHVISRFRSNVNLKYIYSGPRTGKKGRPKQFDGKIDVKNPDLQRMELVETPFDDGKYYTLVAFASALKRKVRLVLYYPDNGTPCKIYFSTDTDMDASEIVEYYRCRFQIEFCFRDSKQFAGLCDCQARSFEKLDFHFNASFTAINVAKICIHNHYAGLGIMGFKSLIYNTYLIKRIFSRYGIRLKRSLNGQLFKELLDIAAPAA